MVRPRAASAAQIGEDDALWYKDAIIYQAHVRAFYDSDSDGIGDFNGLMRRSRFAGPAHRAVGCGRFIIRHCVTTATHRRYWCAPTYGTLAT